MIVDYKKKKVHTEMKNSHHNIHQFAYLSFNYLGNSAVNSLDPIKVHASQNQYRTAVDCCSDLKLRKFYFNNVVSVVYIYMWHCS